MQDDVMVSITCITYNHENYIGDAIDGFLMQKTSFPYEILIHDDASTDRTAEIIREYELKYPDLIKPIYQKENQYSKGVKVGRFNRERATGKYIALCEGDDYWTDPYKLQKQIDYMEANPCCSMCFHSVAIVDSVGRPTGRLINPYKEDCIVPIEELIVAGGGFFGTNSVIYPRQCMENPPDFYMQCPIGDAPLALNLAIQGTVYYINEVMSAYRIGVEGSWSDRLSRSRNRRIRHLKGMIHMRNQFNEYTNYKYSNSVDLIQIRNEAGILIAKGDLRSLNNKRYKNYIGRLGKWYIAKLYLEKYLPNLCRAMVRLKQNFAR